MKWSPGRRTAAAGLLFLAAWGASAFAASTAHDPEIRCCFSQADLRDELKGVFQIELMGHDHPVGHLQLVTPKGTVIGYDERTKSFSRPNSEGLYGLGPPDDMPITDIEWHNSTPRRLVLFRRYPGEYRLHIIGQRDGSYTPFASGPAGRRRVDQAPGNSLVDRFFTEPIRAGEVHTYVFPGQFDDIYDGSIPPNSPTRFRVKRVK